MIVLEVVEFAMYRISGAIRHASGDALPYGESLTLQPAKLVGADIVATLHCLVLQPALRLLHIYSIPFALANGMF